MMITLEQVEKLKERANVGYEDAKIALEATGGDLLDAVIYLEQQGKIKAPQAGSFNTYSGSGAAAAGEPAAAAPGIYGQGTYQGSSQSHRPGPTFRQQMRKLWQGFCRLVHKANTNQFEVYHHDKCIVSLPVTVLILAVLFCFWLTLPLLVVGLFFNYRYKFQGPDMGMDAVNAVMDGAAQTVESIKRTAAKEGAAPQEDQDNHQS